MGYDVTPVQDLAQKLLAAFARTAAGTMEPMIDFDERDLLRFAERTGFPEVQMDAHFQVVSYPRALPPLPEPPETPTPSSAQHEAMRRSVEAQRQAPGWETFLRSSPNPLAPTLAEAMAETLTSEEAERFTAHLRPLYERMEKVERSEVAYLWAAKHPA